MPSRDVIAPTLRTVTAAVPPATATTPMALEKICPALTMSTAPPALRASMPKRSPLIPPALLTVIGPVAVVMWIPSLGVIPGAIPPKTRTLLPTLTSAEPPAVKLRFMPWSADRTAVAVGAASRLTTMRPVAVPGAWHLDAAAPVVINDSCVAPHVDRQVEHPRVIHHAGLGHGARPAVDDARIRPRITLIDGCGRRGQKPCAGGQCQGQRADGSHQPGAAHSTWATWATWATRDAAARGKRICDHHGSSLWQSSRAGLARGVVAHVPVWASQFWIPFWASPFWIPGLGMRARHVDSTYALGIRPASPQVLAPRTDGRPWRDFASPHRSLAKPSPRRVLRSEEIGADFTARRTLLLIVVAHVQQRAKGSGRGNGVRRIDPSSRPSNRARSANCAEPGSAAGDVRAADPG